VGNGFDVTAGGTITTAMDTGHVTGGRDEVRDATVHPVRVLDCSGSGLRWAMA
jgi:hypothetical protein